MLMENRKLLKQRNKKSRVKSVAGAALGGETLGCEESAGADCDTVRDPIWLDEERQGSDQYRVTNNEY
jgi:hypothetical protein